MRGVSSAASRGQSLRSVAAPPRRVCCHGRVDDLPAMADEVLLQPSRPGQDPAALQARARAARGALARIRAHKLELYGLCRSCRSKGA